jgi:methyl-accepting chemotaxis protein
MARSLSVRDKLQITSSDLSLRKSWAGITDEDLELIRACKPFLVPVADKIIQDFYDYGFQFNDFVKVVQRSNSNRSTLEGAQKQYFLSALEGRIDETYVDRRLVIGARHAMLDIQPRWNVGAYSLYFSLVYPYMVENLEGETLKKTLGAWAKIMMFDLTLAIEGYISEGMLTRLVTASTALNKTTGEVSSAAGDVNKAAQEIAKAVNEIAVGASRQTESMGVTAEQMKQLGVAIGEVSQAASRTASTAAEGASVTTAVSAGVASVSTEAGLIDELATRAKDEATAGQDKVVRTVKALETIREAVNLAARQVEELGKRGEEIGGIIETIDDVASQTNLLALNAAIEAARAGEQGRGFAVVADNVRTLAERAAESSKEIAKLISSVQKGTEQTVQAMKAGVEDVERGISVASEAGEALDAIVTRSDELTKGIRRINDSARDMTEKATQLQNSMDELGGVSQQLKAASDSMTENREKVDQSVSEATAQAEQAAAASEQVSAGVEEVTAQIAEVSERTGQLDTQVEMLDKIALLVLETEERMDLYREAA